MTADLYVETEGDGPALLLLHGFTGSTATMWPLGRTLTDRRTVLAVDLPGHGRTGLLEPPDHRFEATLAALVRILDQRGIDQTDVLGYSMGGRLALGLAVRHPDRARSTVLVGSTAGYPTDAERAARRRSDAALADDLIERGLEWFVDHWMALPLFESQKRLGDHALAEARSLRLANEPDGLVASLLGSGTGAQPSFWGELDAVRGPALLVVGDEDARYRRLAFRLASGLGQATIEVVPEAGHAAHLENLPAVSAAIRSFLDGVDGT
ncbi:MAG: 2-succinyl-6-hydroxy-2,4-cyclohexadiene-1-carboxylate synthase [Acidimicrobiales bacterium]|nr:2-succinyl-6-hydroxy-2,4-cyclohexadiene-1-carboxylate synthase [Acidimicrobiales bacterium]